MDHLLTVHDPRGYPPKVAGKGLAARQPSLDGRLLYLVDCLFDNSEAFMIELQRWFAANLPSISTRIIKPRASWNVRCSNLDLTERCCSAAPASATSITQTSRLSSKPQRRCTYRSTFIHNHRALKCA